MVNNMLERLKTVLSEIENGNNLGEKILLVGATKTKDVQTINCAIENGLKIVAENRVQEFNAKYEHLQNVEHHFIGHLQSNKVKYLIGKVSLIHSVDSESLCEIIDKIAEKRQTVQKILIEVNVGGELSKSGFTPENTVQAVENLSKFKNVEIKGLMAMLPKSDDQTYLAGLCLKMRGIFDSLKARFPKFEYLSMGMSNDYKIAIKNGSNMIRLGKTIFGERGEN